MYRARDERGWGGAPADHDHDDARRSTLVQCAIARSVFRAARAAGVPPEPSCEESLHVVEQWCRGRATAIDVRNAAREVVLRRMELGDVPTPCVKMCDAVLRACDEAQEALDGNPLERPSQVSFA